MANLKKSWKELSHASWLYPFKGIYYSLTHPFLYPLFRGRLIPALLLCLFVVVNLFVWTYVPQWLFLRLYQGPVAFWNATVLVLGESTAIAALLFEAFFIDEAQVDMFDAVLINEGCADLVSHGREVLSSAIENTRDGRDNNSSGHGGQGHSRGATRVDDPAKRLGRPFPPAAYSPFSFRQIIEFVLFLPLNFIPVIGPILFLVLIGRRAGPLHHWRYFRLRGFDKTQRKRFEKERKLRYTWFGTAAMVLQLIPVLSMAFLCTTAVGSALWAVRLEELRRAGNLENSNGQGQGREEVERHTQEETYADDPV